MYTVKNIPIQVKAVLDPCSTTSLITESLVEKLQYIPESTEIQISGIDGIVRNSCKRVHVTFWSNVNKNVSFNIACSVLNKITEKLPQFSLHRGKIQIPSNIQLGDPSFHIPSKVELLLGADIYYSLITGGIIKLQKNFLTLLETKLGYIIGGPIPKEVISYYSDTQSSYTSSCFFVQSSNPNEILQKFWEIEEIPSKEKILTPDEELAENIFKNSTRVLEDGSFQVNLPLKSQNAHLQLGQSYAMAKTRFLNLEKRFAKNPSLFAQYKSFIDEYVSLNHARIVPLSFHNKFQENKYFIPHHCVIREESASTKLRVVFDASMKTSSKISLNDIMLKGFTVQPELFDILCRFRTFTFVLTCDIQKMYRMIKINPSQTFLQNILWRENPTEPLKCVELLTVSYGTNSAPYLATRTLNELANRNKETCPLASDVLLTQCYVDDILCGSNSLATLKETHNQLVQLLNSANFSLHKWGSNNSEFLKTVLKNTSQQNVDLKNEMDSNKVLGISWDPSLDQFLVTLPKIIDSNLTTKRSVLSGISQLFDPLGLIAPIIIVAKILMQNIWIAKIDWDENLNYELLRQWTDFVKNIPQLLDLKIPRLLFSKNKICKVELHGFCDASLKAYGAAVYIRTIYSDNSVSCNLVAAKSRVAPIKTISLPRLELSGALLLSHLVEKLMLVFENKISISQVNLWTDSEIVLCWLKAHPSKWSIFVSNRVSEIQQLTSNFSWLHVCSENNPADFVSRGMTPQEIIHCPMWWHGPPFLKNPELDLNIFCSKETNLENIPEKRQTKSALHTLQKHPYLTFWNTIFSKFSSIGKLKRVLAYCLRFVKNSKPNSKRIFGPLCVKELQNSQFVIIKNLQQLQFSREISEINSNRTISNRAILQLSPFIDKLGLLRVGGRLKHSDVPYDQKFPILLPSKNIVTILMLQFEHVRMGHAGAQTTLSNFRLQYWPLNGTVEVKRIIRKCIVCHRFRAKNCEQIMADLPSDRVIPSRPFSKVGVDYGGPFFIKSSTLRKAPLVKGYIVVFVCMISKAVHIELVSSLSTESFILTFKRFISRRGNPSIIYSDNATNFLGSKNQLKEIYDFFKTEKNNESIIKFLNSKEIQWKFIPPKSPHWGGIWEAAIKSTKYHLYRIVGNTRFTFEEFNTILTQIEAILNSRPLQPLSSDPKDSACLTPGHFLIGDSLTSFPEKDVSNIQENRLNRFEKCTRVQQHFWNRWTKEYLNQLQHRPKWLHSYPNLKINDIVLLKEENSRPLEWPLARVIEIIPSKDNKVRVVKIKTQNGIFTRSITKLCPLPHNEN